MTPPLAELAPLLRAAAALGVALLLFAGLAWLLRRHGAGRLGTGSPGRLAIAASQTVDARVRLVLVRRDTVEHLLAIGPAGITVIETLPAAGAREPAA